MDKMAKARVNLEEIRKLLVERADKEKKKEFSAAADRISEALQHFDHATWLVDQVERKL